MSDSDFSSFISELNNLGQEFQQELYDGVNEVGRRMSENARDFSARDTDTLMSSWEIRQDNIINEDGNKEIEVWSNPSIIATNPKHPNGEYYSIPQEEGWIDGHGKWHSGRWMLSSAISIAQDEFPQVIENKIDKLFNW